MKYAYANVEHDDNAGRWVVRLHDKPVKFFLDPEQAEKMEIDGDLTDFAIYTRLVKFNPDDQFATIITPEKVAEITGALDDFIKTIEVTGGLTEDSEGSGMLAPVADDTWVDIGDDYMKACAAMGREPITG